MELQCNVCSYQYGQRSENIRLQLIFAYNKHIIIQRINKTKSNAIDNCKIDLHKYLFVWLWWVASFDWLTHARIFHQYLRLPTNYSIIFIIYAIDQLLPYFQHIGQFKHILGHLTMWICRLLQQYQPLQNPFSLVDVIAPEIVIPRKCYFQDLSLIKTSTAETQALTMIPDVSSLCFNNPAFWARKRPMNYFFSKNEKIKEC